VYNLYHERPGTAESLPKRKSGKLKRRKQSGTQEIRERKRE
jgi:hypothetical protein